MVGFSVGLKYLIKDFSDIQLIQSPRENVMTRLLLNLILKLIFVFCTDIQNKPQDGVM